MIQILQGDCLKVLPTLDAQSVQCCVTSPPYWGLRDYGVDSQLGLESTPAEYIYNLVSVFREVWRILKDDGVVWINLGDSYASDIKGSGGGSSKSTLLINQSNRESVASAIERQQHTPTRVNHGLKPKDLCMIPARVAIALQSDGWYLRSEIVWAKPNPMPESVTDRCTKSHEMIYMIAKKERYFYDSDAIRETALRPEGAGNVRPQSIDNQRNGENANMINGLHKVGPREYRNKRSVWTVPSHPYPESHFATFPPDLIKPCILAGSRVGDTILDPFAGSGTTGMVSLELGRKSILIELNPKYCEMIDRRTNVTVGMF